MALCYEITALLKIHTETRMHTDTGRKAVLAFIKIVRSKLILSHLLIVFKLCLLLKLI